MKRFAMIAALLIVIALSVNHAYDAAQTRPTPRASLGRNFELVGQEVRERFPGLIVAADPYNADNGYIMSFRVRQGATPAQVAAITDYAYPRWVMIRRWAGMGQHAGECNVTVFDPSGDVVSPVKTAFGDFSDRPRPSAADGRNPRDER